MILKSIIGKKTRATALLVEVVVVTIIGWLIIEPVAINTTKYLMPAGYDYDRLVMLTIDCLDEQSHLYDESYENTERKKMYGNLLRMIREREGVENATLTSYQSFEMNGRSSNGMHADSIYIKKGVENLDFNMTSIIFFPKTDFFATFGIKDANGKLFQEPEMTEGSYIISNSVAKALFPETTAIGKEIFPVSDWCPYAITAAGITADMPYVKGDGRIGTYYQVSDIDGWASPHAITMRLRDGVNKRKFIENLTTDLSRYRSGNFYLTHPVSMSDQRDEIFAEKQRDLTQKWIIVAFFFVNVFLGVAGTFYVQCKTRIPDAGVMRAFGAPRSAIIRNIVGEALITTFIGWIIGSAIYLIYLKSKGFPMETDASPIMQYLRPMWHDTKLGRYSVIGGIILLLLLVTSALGAWLPARKVGRVPIVDSLHDE
ncbi:MAG: ABC transporter permease [Muribaculaceae bacterium]|nr:ABC transporter permease [Muribaculaceae bacterium]